MTDLGDLESQNKYSLSSEGQIQVNEESSSSENSSDYTLGKNGEYRLYQTMIHGNWKIPMGIHYMTSVILSAGIKKTAFSC